MKRVLSAAVFAAVVATGCSDGGPSREEAMQSLADATIVPEYQAMTASATDLVSKVDGVCAGPTPDRVLAATAAVDTTRVEWSRSEAMWVGPVMTSRSWALIDYPVNPADIDENLATPALTTFDTNTVGRRVAADERGLGAIEYLLSANGAADPRRCQYASSAAKVVRNESQRIVDQWTTASNGQPPYRETFAGRGEGGDVEKSLDATINDSINLLRKMGDTELGGALGTPARTADANAIPEGPSGQGKAVALARLDGIEAVVVGQPGKPGLSPLLEPELRTRLLDQITATRNAFEAIDGPLRAAVVSNRSAVANAKAGIDQLRTLMTTEIVSALGVTVGFSDQDGDSAG